MSGLQAPAPGVYRRHRPETTALYEVVRDNLETLYGAIGDGAMAVRIPKHARKELEAYLNCGLLCGATSMALEKVLPLCHHAGPSSASEAAKVPWTVMSRSRGRVMASSSCSGRSVPRPFSIRSYPAGLCDRS